MIKLVSTAILLAGLLSTLSGPALAGDRAEARPTKAHPTTASARAAERGSRARRLVRPALQRVKAAATVGGQFLRGTFVDGPKSTCKQVKQHKWAALGTVVVTAAAIHGVQYVAAQLGVPISPAAIAAGMIALHVPHAVGEARTAHRKGGAGAAARSLGKSLGFPIATLGLLEAAALGLHGAEHGATHAPTQGHGATVAAPAEATGAASCLPSGGYRPTPGQLATCTTGGAHAVAEQAHLAELSASTTRTIARGAARGAEELEAAEGLLTRLGRLRPRLSSLRSGLRGAVADVEAAPAASRLIDDVRGSDRKARPPR